MNHVRLVDVFIPFSILIGTALLCVLIGRGCVGDALGADDALAVGLFLQRRPPTPISLANSTAFSISPGQPARRSKPMGNAAANGPSLPAKTGMPAPVNSLITDRFLDALEVVESGRNPSAVGDHGSSVGSFQFTAAAWEQVNTLRRARGLATYPTINRVHHAVARLYAREYCAWLESYLARHLRRPPTLGELYAAYNCGPSRFKRLGFSLQRTPATTRRAVEKLKNEL